jgi:hypothetical protein
MADMFETLSQEYLRKRRELEEGYSEAVEAQTDEVARKHIQSKRRQAVLELEDWLINQYAATLPLEDEGVPHEAT